MCQITKLDNQPIVHTPTHEINQSQKCYLADLHDPTHLPHFPLFCLPCVFFRKVADGKYFARPSNYQSRKLKVKQEITA